MESRKPAENTDWDPVYIPSIEIRRVSPGISETESKPSRVNGLKPGSNFYKKAGSLFTTLCLLLDTQENQSEYMNMNSGVRVQ